MKRLILEGPGALAWSSAAIPQPRVGEALVRVRRCCVSAEELAAYAGASDGLHYPRCLGHELCVEVIRGEGTEAAGTLCAVERFRPCGACICCRRGEKAACRNPRLLGLDVDGGLCEFLAIPVENLLPAAPLRPDYIPLVGSFMIGVECVKRARVRPGQLTAVLGLDMVGLAAALFAQAAGARVVALDPNAARLDRARRFLPGAAHISTCLNLTPLRVRGISRRAAVAIDSLGTLESARAATRLAEPQGTTAFAGRYTGDLILHDPRSRQGPRERSADVVCNRETLLREVIAQISATGAALDTLITERFSFCESAERLSALAIREGRPRAMIAFD